MTEAGTETMSNFQREERYIVIKRKTLLPDAEEMLREYLGRNQIPTVECVVVESDWPEYDAVWGMIERRAASVAERGSLYGSQGGEDPAVLK